MSLRLFLAVSVQINLTPSFPAWGGQYSIHLSYGSREVEKETPIRGLVTGAFATALTFPARLPGLASHVNQVLASLFLAR